ncbi:MAG: triphosphoribosyl-dephospho-CoA synthase [Ignisphaera sp.]|uniref:Triphosphoribosyl-dephospho-CoA synthase n=1 Tax=Ignisphaera aggregans TaxID=334771 RepID=A0A7J3MXF2_9CREN
MSFTNIIKYAEKLALGIALEASAFPKPGNVHRLRDFDDTIYEDFIATAIESVYPLYRGIRRGYRYGRSLDRLRIIYGDIILDMVGISKVISGGGNTCLGTALLLSPLSVALGRNLILYGEINIDDLLSDACACFKKYSTVLDAIYFYRAIRIARPSYIKKSDVTGEFPSVWSKKYRQELIEKNLRLWNLIEYSSSYDIVAREIVECYPRSYTLSKYILARLKNHGIWNRAIVETYLYQLSSELDTLVVRKNGYEVAQRVKEEAKEVMKLCKESWTRCLEKLKAFDDKLASARVNPGSTADIVAVAISIYSLYKNQSLFRVT